MPRWRLFRRASGQFCCIFSGWHYAFCSIFTASGCNTGRSFHSARKQDSVRVTDKRR